MGPAVILDKSALQYLPNRLIFTLHKTFHVNFVPELLYEVLADLHKRFQEKTAEEEVSQLSSKLSQLNSFQNVKFNVLIEANLLGNRIIMDGRPVVQSVEVPGSRGKKVLTNPTALQEAVVRWRSGTFTDEEKTFSRKWRDDKHSVDIEHFKKSLAPLFKDMKVGSVNELPMAVDKLLGSLSPNQLLGPVCENFSVSKGRRAQILERWNSGSWNSFEEFAPYAWHCLRVFLTYQAAIIFDVLSPERSSAIDMRYLYYLPFCIAFISGDNVHQTLSPLFLKQNQRYLDREKLKSSLEEVLEHDNDISFSPIIKSLYDLCLDPNAYDPEPEEDIETFEVRRIPDPDEFCPCMSGKKFSECHG